MKAISIDDEEINLLVLEEIAKTAGLEVQSFLNPLVAAEYVRSNPVDIAFVDYLMPDMNGLQMVSHIRRFSPDIPIVMITSLADRQDIKIKALEAGATEFMTKPIDAVEFIARTKNLMSLRKYQILLMDRALHLEDEVRKATKIISDREFETLSVLGRAAEYKDPETKNHIERVAHATKLIAEAMSISKDQQELVFHAAPLHDVGKMGIPDSILLKPSSLSAEEFLVIKTHTEIGYNILKSSKSNALAAGAEIAMTHHERFSGGGYPRNMKGKAIPFFGRIVAVADSYDAMISRRPYKEPMSLEKVTGILVSEKAKQFDPEIVDVFLKIIPAIVKLYDNFMD